MKQKNMEILIELEGGIVNQIHCWPSNHEDLAWRAKYNSEPKIYLVDLDCADEGSLRDEMERARKPIEMVPEGNSPSLRDRLKEIQEYYKAKRQIGKRK